MALQKRSHRADEYIRLVKDHLEVAVEQCIEAAGYEFETRNQMMLIRVSAYVLNKCIFLHNHYLGLYNWFVSYSK